MAARCDSCIDTSLNTLGLGLYHGVEFVKATPKALVKVLPSGVVGALAGSKLVTAVGFGTGFAQGVAFSVVNHGVDRLFKGRIDDKKKIDENAAPFIKLVGAVAAAGIPVLAVTYGGGLIPAVVSDAVSSASTYCPEVIRGALVSSYPAAYTLDKQAIIAAALLVQKYALPVVVNNAPDFVTSLFSGCKGCCRGFKEGFSSQKSVDPSIDKAVSSAIASVPVPAAAVDATSSSEKSKGPGYSLGRKIASFLGGKPKTE